MGWLLVPQYPAVGSIRICIADGSSSDFEKYLVQWRLAEPTTNIGWSAWVTEEAISRPFASRREFPEVLVHRRALCY